MSNDDLDPLRRLRPDPDPDEPAEPTVFAREKERLMTTIGARPSDPYAIMRMPDIFPRLAYADEAAALEYLVRVFQLVEIREARTDFGDHFLAWLRIGGDGVVMVGRANADVHRIHSPHDLGGTTIQLMVRVNNVDEHYAHARREGADITMELNDAFYGERRYEATDLEGHRWHFAEPLEDVRARGGIVPDTPRAGLP